MTTAEFKASFDFFTDKYLGKYFTPEEFELVVNRAQYEDYGLFIGFPERYSPDGQPPAIAYDRTRRIKEALLPFRTERLIPLVNGIGTFPDDFVYVDGLSFRYFINPADCGDETLEPDGVRVYRPIDIITEKEWADRLSSSIDYPTTRFPVCHFLTKNTLEVSPYTIKSIKLVYLRKPRAFYWGRTIQNGEYVSDPTDPLDSPLEWYEIDQNRILMKALSFAGCNIRDNELIQYAEMKGQGGV